LSGRPATASLALGTAQFGLAYGVGSGERALDDAEAAAVLAAAWQGGIDLLETGPAYGDAESRIGKVMPREARFAVISKTRRLGRERIGEDDAREAAALARASLERLRVPRLEALLVHHAPDLLVPGGERLFAALEALRAEGLAGRLGVCVYDAPTLEAVLERFPLQIVQLPLNLLDQRFVRDGAIAALARRGVEVHARSAFLQGVLLTDAARLPARLNAARAPVARLQADCAAAGLSRAAAALAFVARCEGVRRIVIGVNSVAQLAQNLAAFAAAAGAALPGAGRYALDDAAVIDPRRWTP
jgi:aryl-alcohol dehydrogenase-like predicted oxidoreductase